MTSDITEEQIQKNQLRYMRESCLRMAVESNLAQTSEQLIDTAKRIYEFLDYEDK